MFEHELSCIIIDYHQLSCSLDMFKYDMIVDDASSYRLNEQMIVHDGFSASSLVKNELKPRSNRQLASTIMNRLNVDMKMIVETIIDDHQLSYHLNAPLVPPHFSPEFD